MKSYLMSKLVSNGNGCEFRIVTEEDKDFAIEVHGFEAVEFEGENIEFESDDVEFIIGTTNVMWDSDESEEYEEDYSESAERDVYVGKEDVHAFLACILGGDSWDYGNSQNMNGSYDSSVIYLSGI